MLEIHPPTRNESIARACGYAFIAVLGFYALTYPYPDGRSYLGWSAVVVWSVFLLTSLPAAVATLYGRWRVEYMMLPLFGSGLAVAIVSAWIRAGSGDSRLIPSTSIATALLFLLVVRIFALHRITKAAKEWTPTAPSK